MSARQQPRLVTVAIPVLNGEKHIGDQLEALAGQTFAGEWEVVVADNGCSDRTIAVARDLGRRLPSFTIADATGRRGLNHARNVAARAARGDLIAYCDADDMATPGWLEALVRAAPHGDLVGGTLDLDSLNDGVARSLCPWDAPTELPSTHGFMPYVAGGNCCVWTSVAREVRWDERFRFGSSDMEFAWRVQLASYRVHHAADAVMRQRLKPRLRTLARQWYAYGKSDPQLYRRFRRLGMARPGEIEGFESWRELLLRMPELAGPLEARGRWVRAAARKTGRLVGSVRHRVLVL